MDRSYSELIKFPTLIERYEYLKLHGKIGEELFGYARYLNQVFYQSPEWKRIRRKIIIRDNGCDLGLEAWPIRGVIYVHHINPITLEMLKTKDPILLDPDNLICASYNTHTAITIGNSSLLPTEPITRKPNDMCPWKMK